MTRPLRLFLNGFDRIGRNVARQVIDPNAPNDAEIVGINDILDLDTCLARLKADLVDAVEPPSVERTAYGLRIGQRRIPVTHAPNLRDLDLADVDVVLDCTGRGEDRAFLDTGLQAGAARVLVAGPAAAADRMIILGANEHALGDARIVSSACAASNAIAPLLRILDLGLGIERAHATVIDCLSAASLQASHDGLRPAACDTLARVVSVLPEMSDRLTLSTLKVPVRAVAAVDLVLQVMEDPGEPFPDFLRSALAGSTLIGLTEVASASSTFRIRPESLVVALPETRAIGTRQLRLLGWYDKEWAHAARMLELAKHIASRCA